MKCFPDDDFYLSKTPHEKGCKKFSDPSKNFVPRNYLTHMIKRPQSDLEFKAKQNK